MAPSWIRLPLPLVQKSISFFFKERPHKAIPALFLSVFSLLWFSIRDKTYFQTSQLVPIEVWSFSCLLTYWTLPGGTFMEMFVWEERYSHSTCSTPCPAWLVLPPWLPWISQVIRLCCFSFLWTLTTNVQAALNLIWTLDISHWNLSITCAFCLTTFLDSVVNVGSIIFHR